MRRLEDYLGRLGFPLPAAEEEVAAVEGDRPRALMPPPTLATLWELHRCHIRNVPFENIELHCTGAHIVLGSGVLFDKIVQRCRGGFCYEVC